MKTEKKLQSDPLKKPKPHVIEEADREYIKKIAVHAKVLRIKAGYTSYEEFAMKSGINRNSYFRFEKKSAESGENFTMALLLKVTKGLNITMADFFRDIL